MSNKTFMQLSALAFLITKYFFIIFSNNKVEKSELIGFISISVIFIIFNTIKIINDLTTYYDKFSSYFKPLLFSYTTIIIIIFIFSTISKSPSPILKTDIFAILSIFCFVFTTPYIIGLFVEYAQDEIVHNLNSKNEMISEEDLVIVTKKYKNIIIPFIIVSSIFIAYLFSIYSWK